jgi:hypothetical protein
MILSKWQFRPLLYPSSIYTTVQLYEKADEFAAVASPHLTGVGSPSNQPATPIHSNCIQTCSSSTSTTSNCLLARPSPTARNTNLTQAGPPPRQLSLLHTPATHNTPITVLPLTSSYCHNASLSHRHRPKPTTRPFSIALIQSPQMAHSQEAKGQAVAASIIRHYDTFSIPEAQVRK